MAVLKDNIDHNTAVEVDDSTTRNKYLTFEIDGEDYGIEIINIKEIIEMRTIFKVPDTPEFVEGVTSLRGEVIVVLDVRKRFMKPPKEQDELSCIIVIEYDSANIGLIVDNVKEVQTIDEDKIAPPPSAKLTRYNQYIKNIGRVMTEEGEDVKLLLDLDKFLVQE